MLLRSSLHALLYQLCILFIKPGTLPSKSGVENLYHTQILSDNPVNLLCHRPQISDGTRGQCGARKRPVVWWHYNLKHPFTCPLPYPLTSAWCLLHAICLQSLSLPSDKTVSLMVHNGQVVVVESSSCAPVSYTHLTLPTIA